ncbi:MAG: family oxidoreductase [Frankiales bacterium]|jgi:NAD(P)-dependent dehydrogenase (short-subunit alcohol dehydrogenase family)|nr:family oxidoreductase [Frankiales bacterium]
MTGRLAGKVAIVTGAGSGIGREIARRFDREGALVAVTDVDEESAKRVAAECSDSAWSVHLDVTDDASVAAAMADVEGRHGRLDVLANNAGVTMRGSATSVTEQAWDVAFDINVKGVWRMMRDAWPLLVSSDGGVIINQASVASHRGMPNNVGYNGTKGAVLMMTMGAALDGAKDGIRVNCVMPGYIDTQMAEVVFQEQPDPAAARIEAAAAHPLGRLGAPLDIANAFVFFASDEAEWITGASLAVDGGLTAGI